MELIKINEQLYMDNKLNFYKKYNFYWSGNYIIRGTEKKRFVLNVDEFIEFCNRIGDIPEIENNCYYKKLKVTTSKNGYPSVTDTKGKNLYIHRFLAENFIKNPNNKLQVNHIDGNKNNYMIDNLEWVTPKENVQHAIINGLQDKSKSRKEVFIYKTDGSFVCKVMGSEEAKQITGVNRSYITMVIQGKRKSGKGYVFSDKEIVFEKFISKLPKRKVQVDKIDGSFSKVYNSITEARKELKLFNVHKHLSGEYKQVNGYTIKYL